MGRRDNSPRLEVVFSGTARARDPEDALSLPAAMSLPKVSTGAGDGRASARPERARADAKITIASAAAMINRVVAQFIETLPAPRRDVARQLPLYLGLTAVAWTRWADVYPDTALLALPVWLASRRDAFATDDADDEARDASVAAAVTAHVLGFIHGQVTRQTHERRLAANDRVAELLPALAQARDAAFKRVGPGARLVELGYDDAAQALVSAIDLEHALTRRAHAHDLALYGEVVRRKQRLLLPACAALARALEWSKRRRFLADDLVAQIGVGLQCRADAAARAPATRVSWSELLARKPGADAEQLTRRAQVIRARLLDISSDAFIRAAWAARRLELPELEKWSKRQGETSADLAAREEQHPGSAARWAEESQRRLEARQRERYAR